MGKKLTKEQRREMASRIMETARKHPEFKKRVQDVVFKAQRRNLLNEN